MQSVEVAAWQLPLPSQSRRELLVSPVHEAEAHWVVEDHKRQAPLPSHCPSVLQVARGIAGQSLKGSEPSATRMHNPFELGSAQERHTPLQSLWQQTPCEQKPLAQSPGIMQLAPMPALPLHSPNPLQVAPGAQPAEGGVQVVAQASPAQA